MSQKIHLYTSPPDAFFVNSFVIEGTKSLVLIDTQFVLSEAKKITAMIAALEKPLAGIFITHPHPDHYNGLQTVLNAFPATSVYATAATITGIHETAEPKREYWTPLIGTNYPQEFAYPGNVVQDGEDLRIDGIELKISDLGAAECSDNTMIVLPQTDCAIVSDIVYNRVHPWLAEGRPDQWLAALQTAGERLNGAVLLYAGHGAPGPVKLLEDQANYIQDVRDMVRQAAPPDGRLTDTETTALRERIKSAYPGWPLETIIDMSITSLAGG